MIDKFYQEEKKNNADLIYLENPLFKCLYLSSLCEKTLIEKYLLDIDKHFILFQKIAYDNIIDNLISGHLILEIAQGIFKISCKKDLIRDNATPDLETSVKGSKIAFNEDVMHNIALIRNAIGNQKIVIQKIKTPYNLSKIYLLHLDNDKTQEITQEIIKRIHQLKIKTILMKEVIFEEKIIKQKYYIFPLVRFSQRVDIVSSFLLKMKIVILMEGSNNAIILPITLLDNLRSIEEYNQNFLVANFFVLIRFICFLLALFILPLMYLNLTFKEIINIFTPYQISASLPISVQFLLGVLFIEIFKVSIIHTPNLLVGGLSLIMGIILGEASLNLGLFDPLVLIIVALSTICTYALPNYEFSNSVRLLTIILLIIAIVFGVIGYFISLIVLLFYLLNTKLFAIYYLSPFIPFSFAHFFNMIFRRDNQNDNYL